MFYFNSMKNGPQLKVVHLAFPCLMVQIEGAKKAGMFNNDKKKKKKTSDVLEIRFKPDLYTRKLTWDVGQVYRLTEFILL